MEMLERNTSLLVVIVLLASCAGKSEGCTQLICRMLWGPHLDSVPSRSRDEGCVSFNIQSLPSAWGSSSAHESRRR